MSTFLVRSTTSQSSSYPTVLTRLGGPRSRYTITGFNIKQIITDFPGAPGDQFQKLIMQTAQEHNRYRIQCLISWMSRHKLMLATCQVTSSQLKVTGRKVVAPLSFSEFLSPFYTLNSNRTEMSTCNIKQIIADFLVGPFIK